MKVKALLIVASTLVGLSVATVGYTEDTPANVVSTETYQTDGVARFSGHYIYPDDQVNGSDDTSQNTVYQPNDNTNPYYKQANEKNGTPVLPNTGSETMLERFSLPVLLTFIATGLYFVNGKKFSQRG